MAPRVPSGGSEDDFIDLLKPQTENAKVVKAKAPAKPKVAKVKAEKVDKPKVEKPKVVKPKVEKADKADKPAPKKVAAKVAAVGGAAKEEKVKGVVGEEAEALIVEYLRKENRPYSATEISANLRGKVTKTTADKLLKELGERDILKFNATNGNNKGSQFVFWTPQLAGNCASPEELKAMDEQIQALREGNPELRKKAAVLASQVVEVMKQPLMEALGVEVLELQESVARQSGKLRGFTEGTVKAVGKEEIAKVDKALKFWTSKRKARKLAYEGLEDSLLQSDNFNKKQVREDAGIDTDEECV